MGKKSGRPKCLRVLNVEDSERDAALLTRHLTNAGYKIYSQRVQTAEGMKAALEERQWDVVLCDYAMPHFDVLGALAALRASGIDIPFIIISGTVGEEIAVQAMLSGAHDYLSKNNLTRLVPAVERELKEANNRQQLKWEGEERRASEGRYRTLFDQAPDGIIISGPDDYYLDANASMCQMLGYDSRELIGMHASDIVTRSEARQLDWEFALVQSNPDYNREWDFKRKDGSVFPGEVIATIMPDGNLLAMIRDVSEHTEARLKEARLTARIEAQRTRLDTIIESVPGIVWETSWDVHRTVEEEDFVSAYAMTMLGYSVDEWMATPNFWLTIVHEDDRVRVMAKAKEALISGEPSIDEFRWVKKDGQWVWVEARSSIVYDEEGKQIGMRGVTIDINDRKLAEVKLRESEERFSGAFELAPIGVALVFPDGKWLKVNRALCELVGYTEAELLVGKFQDITHPDDLALDLDNLARLVDGEFDHYQIEKRYRHKLGHYISILLNVSLVRDISENPLYFISQIQDITESKQAEAQLRESEALLAASQRITHLGSWVMDISDSGDVIENTERWSDEHYRIYGVEPGEFEITDVNFYNLVHPDDRERLAKTIAEAFDQQKPFEIEHRIIRPDGSERIVLAMAELIVDPETDKPMKLVGSVQDITERKGAEQRLRLQASALDAAANAILITDKNGTILWVNPAFTMITGYSQKEAIGQNPRILKAGNLDEAFYKAMWKTILSGQTWQGELTNRRKDGSTYSELQTITPVIDGAGEITNFIAIKQDITERKLAETLLIESQQSLTLATESASIGIWDWDLVEDTMKWDARMYDLYSNHEEDFSGPSQTWNLNLHPDDVERLYAEFAAAREGTEDFHSEFRVVWPGGEVRHLESSAKVIRDENGKRLHFIGVNWDITERKQLEEQFRQSQKMEAVGVLAGGIAHDFNNLLTAINGYSEITLRRMAADDPLRGNIQEVKKAGDRAAELTTQLLAFSRKQLLHPIVHNLNTVISNIENMLRRVIKENIELRTVLSPDLGNIKADPGQMEQVLMNLAINAHDAMPDGGKLTISTSNVYLDEGYVSQHLMVAPGQFVKLTISDNGHGMANDVKQHIFEPFFTTKGVGQGTGLGLSMVFGIVKQSGGDIMVYSELGRGTVIKIYLPCVDEHIEKTIWKENGNVDIKGTETVLLVEDEEIVRRLVHEILTSNGYKVLESASGPQALSVIENYHEPIHMLLTDVIMPGMGGAELRDNVLKLRPEIRVLFMSGYTDESISHNGVLEANASFIEKPFSPDSLIRKIREVLEH